MPEPSYAFSIYTRLPAGVRINIDDTSMNFACIGNIHNVSLSSKSSEIPIKESDVLVFTCNPNASEEEATSIAVDVKNRLKLASVKSNLGLDCGDDIPRGGASSYLINMLEMNNNIQIINERIGIAVYKNDIDIASIGMNVNMQASRPIDEFKEFIEEGIFPFHNISERQSLAMDFFNYSHHEKNGWASFLCIMMSVEILFPQKKKKGIICEYAEKFAEIIRRENISSEVKSEITNYITNMKQESVIKSCTHGIERICDAATAQSFRELYKTRSSIAHGRIPPNVHVPETSTAYEIAKRIISASVSSDVYQSLIGE